MRVLVVPSPRKTHLHNLVPLAWPPRAAGRPDLLDAVTGAGLTALGVGPGETPRVRAERDRRRTASG